MVSILFDLDGTLFDTSEGIIKGILEVERIMGLDSQPYETKRSFIGPPLINSFVQYYNLSEKDAKEAVRLFRKYYSEKGKYEAVPYVGIIELLRNIKAYNMQIFVATSKPTEFAKDIVAHFGMRDYFVDIVGSNMDHSRGEKCEVIKHILDEYSCNPVKTIMIGDKEQDVIGAKLAGVQSIGVTYGFGSRNEIEKSNSDKIATSVKDIEFCIKEICYK